MTTTPAAEPKTAREEQPAAARQFVNFMFFRVDRAFRALPIETRIEARAELAQIITRYSGPMIVLPYSTVGLKAGIDFMLWRIGYDLDPFQRMVADINQSILGRYLDVPASYLAMTKHSQYVDDHVHEGQEGRRLRIVPGNCRWRSANAS
jgi:chlorite dismutase